MTDAAQHHGLRVLKGVGDGFLLTGDDASEAIAAACELVEAMEQVEFAPAVRIGIHAGPVSVRGGDVFGATVNIAARIASEAHPRQALVTSDVLRLAGHAGTRAVRVGTRTLRNVFTPVELFAICHDRTTNKMIDPICRMLVSPETAAGSLRHGGKNVYFCSTDCLSRFIQTKATPDD